MIIFQVLLCSMPIEPFAISVSPQSIRRTQTAGHFGDSLENLPVHAENFLLEQFPAS